MEKSQKQEEAVDYRRHRKLGSVSEDQILDLAISNEPTQILTLG